MAATGGSFQGFYSGKANADLSAAQYKIVKMTAADVVDLCSGTGDIAIGVLNNKPKANAGAQVLIAGVGKVIAGGTITAGDRIGTGASGTAVTKTADADWIIGIALTSGVSGELVSYLAAPAYRTQ